MKWRPLLLLPLLDRSLRQRQQLVHPTERIRIADVTRPRPVGARSSGRHRSSLECGRHRLCGRAASAAPVDSAWPPRDGLGSGLDELAAIALITGTGVGGGFLALPYTTAAAGAWPSSTVLVALWLFMLGQSMLLVDVIVEASNRSQRPVSFSTVARQYLGKSGGAVVCTLFLMLMLLTHVSQFAKGGQLLSAALGVPYFLGVLLVAAGLSSFALLGPVRVVGLLNTLLTAGFVVAVGVLFSAGVPLARWDRLLRADWPLCVKQIPATLQILVYLEVLPTVCRLVNFDRWRARRAVLIGALALLMLNLGWSLLGIGLVAFSGRWVDPVSVILRHGGPVAMILGVIATCAISTTIVGTNISLKTFFADACQGKHRRLPGLLCGLSVLVPVLLALSSPNVFFKALDLQGAYPLTILWGCLPPLIALSIDIAAKSLFPKTKTFGIVLLLIASTLLLLGRLSADLYLVVGRR